jgi:lambda family phage portal protein
MKILDKIKFSIGRWALKGFSRGFSEVTGIGRQMTDWVLSGLSDDADLQSNWPALVQRSRDLFKMNPYMRKFRSDLITNVFGSEGITLQMKIKEETDRVVYAAEEKSWLIAKQRANEEWCKRAKRVNMPFPKREYIRMDGERIQARSFSMLNGAARAKATVKAGQPDVFANNLIERAWRRWQKRENCTVGKRHTYAQTREHRLVQCARDGDCFIRHVRGKAGARNDFGYAIQIIASEWVDHSLNIILTGGRYIKMGIEYDAWGAAVAYHVIKRQPGDWQSTSVRSPGRWAPGMSHERVDARDMIHYCQFEDAESGRGGPWITSVTGLLRHLQKYAEAEVISARAEACKGGHYESTMPGLDADVLADKIEKNDNDGERLTSVVEPAVWKFLPYGVTAKAHDPRHPSGNFAAFKKETLREVCAGIGDQYNTLAGDLEGVNYSSMRSGALDIRELWMLTQRFDIDSAEVPIFEAWLEMALANGAIPLPLSKIEKFNQPQFQGRRWPWVDPLKDAKADQAAVDSFFTSRTQICNENGADFEDIIEQQAIERILIEEAGLAVSNAAEIPEETPDGTIEEPAPKKSKRQTKPAGART